MILRNEKITLGEMRASGVRGLLIYCADYQCSHWVAISDDQWAAGFRISNRASPVRPCGTKGADVRPHFGAQDEVRPVSRTYGTALLSDRV